MSSVGRASAKGCAPLVALVTLGCKVNQAETESLAGELAAAGMTVTSSVESAEADAIVVNTCTVTAESDRKMRKMVRRLRHQNPEAHLVVTGCYAERVGEAGCRELGADAVVPNGRKAEIGVGLAERLLGHVTRPERSLGTEGATASAEGNADARPAAPVDGRVLHTRALVKIQDGCDSGCSYCVVPSVRGRPTSLPEERVIARVRQLISQGVAEIVLTGVNLGLYGRGAASGRLAALLRILTAIPGETRFRLSSLELDLIDDELFDIIQSNRGVCRHLHVPLQSGDRGVLEAMGRGYRPADYTDAIGRWREVLPGLAVTTDVMVGFPGEDAAAFEETLRVAREARFNKMHVFSYSPRPGTRAAELGLSCAPGEAARRSRELRGLGDELAASWAEAARGDRLGIVIEKAADGTLTGVSDNYFRVFCPGPADLVGRLAEVEIVGSRGPELEGRLA